MSSLPRASTFRWTFTAPADSNNVSATIPIPADQTVSNGTHSRLAYVADTEKDFGELRCFAKNELGESEAPCRFKLVAAGKQNNLGFVVLKCIQSLPFLTRDVAAMWPSGFLPFSPFPFLVFALIICSLLRRRNNGKSTKKHTRCET